MSIGPTSPSARRGFDPGSFTQSKRQEQIQRRWTFLDGLVTSGIKITSGDRGLLTLELSGEVVATRSPTEDFDFGGAITFSGTDLIAAVDALEMTSSDATRLLIGMDTLAGRPVFVGQDPPAVAASRLGKVDATAQTADIASTALSNTPLAGMYEVEAYLMTTTADAAAGTLAVTIGWTDAVGATTANVIAAHALTATGRSTGRQILNLASGNITYAVTVTGAYGTSAYAIAVRVVSLG